MQPTYGFYKLNVNGVDQPMVMDSSIKQNDPRVQSIQPADFVNLTTRNGTFAANGGTQNITPTLANYLGNKDYGSAVASAVSSLGYKIQGDNLVDANGKVLGSGYSGTPTPVSASGSSSPTGTTTPAGSPVQTASQAAGAATAPQAYTIQKGDTLSAIAEKNGTNIQALMAANPSITNPNVIKAGASLNIPGAPAGTAAGGKANQYQNDLHKAISGVTDQNNTAAVGAAAAAVKYGSNLAPDVSSALDTAVSTIQSNLTAMTTNAPKSLVDTYKQMSSDMGIDSLETQYMNLENVINGTPDDIRAEVTKAGGFMSESQVQALSAARDKNLITQANTLQQQIQYKQSTLSTLVGLQGEDQQEADKRIESATNLSTTLLSTVQSMQKNASDRYDKIVANVGYQGLASALGNDPYTKGLAEQALGLPTGTLSNAKSLSALETYRQQSLSQAATKINISTSDPSKEALTISRYTMASNRLISNYVKLPAYTLLANASPMLSRIESASTVPGSVSDADLLDSVVKLNTGGGAVTEAQVKTITDGRSYSDSIGAWEKKLAQGGILSDDQRKQLMDVSEAVYSGYQKMYEPIYDKATAQLKASNIPEQYWTLPSLNDLSTAAGVGIQATGAGESATKTVGGVDYYQASDGNWYPQE